MTLPWLETFSQTELGLFLVQQGVYHIAPELILILTLLTGWIQGCLDKSEKAQDTFYLTLTGLLITGFCLLQQLQGMHLGAMPWGKPSVLFGMLHMDGFATLMRLLLVLGAFIVLLMSRGFVQKRLPLVASEFYGLLMVATLGGLFLTGATDMVMLFVSLETLGITSYLLAGYLRNSPVSSEASLKYLIYGGTSSAILLLGMALLYGMTGDTLLTSLMGSSIAVSPLKPLLPVAMMLLTVGIGFKLSAAPFHYWTPDVYQGAPAPVGAFLSVVSKLAAFTVFIRLLGFLLPLQAETLMPILWLLSVLSMIVGNTGALFQKDVKRLLGFSTIAHVGYVLLGLLVLPYRELSPDSLSAVIFYLASYLFMNLGAFACAHQLESWLGSSRLEAASGLAKKRPGFVLVFSIFLLGLAGIPITAGFFSKFFLFQTIFLHAPHLWALLLFALLASVVSLAYYVNLMRVMVIGSPSREVEAYNPEPGLRLALTPMRVAMALCLLGTLLFGFYADPMYKLFYKVSQPLTQSQPYLSLGR
jgi:NAD(P)H-quinone oxidoreductase subunit 2